MTHKDLHKHIESTSNIIGNTWPLYSFVTSNPLAGYQDMTFNKAVEHAKSYLGSNVYPKGEMLTKALNEGSIKKNILEKNLKDNGFTDSPENYLNLLSRSSSREIEEVSSGLDRITAKWLSAFFDEGMAEWEMPNKKKGFYKAWRKLAMYDSILGIASKNEIPKTSEETLINLLEPYTNEEIAEIFTQHLAALPGWTGYIKYRITNQTEWQKSYPITLTDYLAVRLFIAKQLNLDFLSKKTSKNKDNEILKLQHIFLQSWEISWQDSIKNLLENQQIKTKKQNTRPNAQMVFCIDTRSELIRRHIEKTGNYETFGYAGFFGIATDYENIETGVVRKSCPPILPSSYKTSEIPQLEKGGEFKQLKKTAKRISSKNYILKRLKNMLPSAFGFVEGTGIFYGFAMILRTLAPSKSKAIKIDQNRNVEKVCEPHLKSASHQKNKDVSVNEKVTIVKTAFDLLGWRNFAPVVVFAGHGSHTANNPFASSLDCGACAASPGRHNARMLAKLANDKEVRTVLSIKFGIEIPNDTIFIGAEHNTTTDFVELFDSHIPESHNYILDQIKQDLSKAQTTATKERLNLDVNSKNAAIKKSLNWSETRPEWGLAKNAGFIIGSRNLTKNLNLDGSCFLHSYDWELDTKGKALQGIMQGPMVVTQWINNHYYFSTVDNEVFGGGTKITHNVVGKFGVVQGNGGDLKTGLPLQSVNVSDTEIYHQPLRLSVFIHAPKTRVSKILLNNKNLKSLLDNEWIYLIVIDPLDSNKMLKYETNLNWTLLDQHEELESEEKITFTKNKIEEEVFI
ncbi:DUF2309 domain-containing protein [Winogradskyella poriferorum]|uniref:DUF2309 domain-containing protein n=1 Tax=Winogradskyella poriferorum TaxID=307627 RepID=UPI003D64803C